MARGKYGSSAEARRAREDAIAKASKAERRAHLAEEENARLRERLAAYEADTAALISQRVSEFHAKVAAAEATAREAQRTLRRAGEVINNAMARLIQEADVLGMPMGGVRGQQWASHFLDVLMVDGSLVPVGQCLIKTDHRGELISVERLPVSVSDDVRRGDAQRTLQVLQDKADRTIRATTYLA